jgi:hypothetical protein
MLRLSLATYFIPVGITNNTEELDGSALGVRSWKLSNVYKTSVIKWVTKTYYLKFFRASEGTLSRWSRLHLQSLAALQFQEELTSGRLVVKIIAGSLSQHDQNYVITGNVCSNPHS